MVTLLEEKDTATLMYTHLVVKSCDILMKSCDILRFCTCRRDLNGLVLVVWASAVSAVLPWLPAQTLVHCGMVSRS